MSNDTRTAGRYLAVERGAFDASGGSEPISRDAPRASNTAPLFTGLSGASLAAIAQFGGETVEQMIERLESAR